MMLKVNRMSNNRGGKGITNMAMINKTKAGNPSPARSKRAKFCRIADQVNVLM
jgi:hypothetical protein